MKDLYSIYEKLSIDDIGAPRFGDEFPIDKSLKVIVKYLKRQGFKEENWYSIVSMAFGGFVKNFNKLKEKAFIMYNKDNYTCIRFANTLSNTISINNPVFTINKDKGANWRFFIEYIDAWDEELSQSEWLQKLNECFK